MTSALSILSRADAAFDAWLTRVGGPRPFAGYEKFNAIWCDEVRRGVLELRGLGERKATLREIRKAR